MTQGGVPWREAARIGALCWAVLAVVYGILHLFHQTDTFPIGFPVVVLMANWFMNRHRYWVPGGVAALVGSLVTFALIDVARLHLDRLTADTLSVATGSAVSVLVFTAASRLTRRPKAQRATVT